MEDYALFSPLRRVTIQGGASRPFLPISYPLPLLKEMLDALLQNPFFSIFFERARRENEEISSSFLPYRLKS